MKECSTKMSSSYKLPPSNNVSSSASSYKLSLWTPNKLSNAHSGSAPSLVSDQTLDRGDNPANPNPWIKTAGHDDLNKTRYLWLYPVAVWATSYYFKPNHWLCCIYLSFFTLLEIFFFWKCNPFREDSSSSATSALMSNRAKEIKKLILGKMRRSNSGNLHDDKKKKEKLQRASEDPSAFSRGGFNR